MADEERISVSRDKLRADLAEMELRLRAYFDTQLAAKASADQLVIVAAKLDSLDRGDFTPVHERALTDFVEGVLAERTDKGWTATQRVFMVVGTFVAIMSLFLSLYVTTAGASTGPAAHAATHLVGRR